MSFWRDYLSLETRWVDAAGIRTRCQIGGSGAPLLFLHGRGGHLETWVRNMPALSQRFRVIAIDLLGHGLTSPAADGQYDVASLSRHVHDVLDALQLDHVHVVGQSLGAWVAAHMALTHAARVDRLALIEPAGLLSEEERLADPMVADKYRTGGAAYDNPTRDAVRIRLAGLLKNPGDLDDEMVEIRWELYQPAIARDVHKRVRKANNASVLLTPDRLRKLRPATLFLRGEDGHTPVDVVTAAIAACPEARGMTIAGARQWPQYEQAAAINATLETFFE